MLLYLSYSEQYNYNLSEVIPGLYQEYVDVHPVNCDRGNNPNRVNKIDNKVHWEVTIPHPWLSGKCFTYKSVLKVAALEYDEIFSTCFAKTIVIAATSPRRTRGPLLTALQ